MGVGDRRVSEAQGQDSYHCESGERWKASYTLFPAKGDEGCWGWCGEGGRQSGEGPGVVRSGCPQVGEVLPAQGHHRGEQGHGRLQTSSPALTALARQGLNAAELVTSAR